MKKIECKSIMAVVFAIIMVFLSSFSLVATAYGATLDFSEGNPWVYIRNASNGKYLSTSTDGYTDGDEIELREWKKDETSQLWIIKQNDDGLYSIHVFSNENFVLALENENDANGAKIVLKDVSGYNSIPDSALFWNFNYIPMQVSYLYNVKSMKNENTRAITYESANGMLTCSNVKSGIDNSIVQCWVFEDTVRLTPLLNWDLVDSGGHCDWDCSSQYYSMVKRAADAWNDYIGAEVYRDDAWNIVQDVKIKDLDVDPTGEGALACTYSNNILVNGGYASSIYFYTEAMGGLNSDLKRQKVVMHELGHALGLGHNRTINSSDKLGNIMQQGELPYSTYISLDDKASVAEAYAGF